MKSLMLFFQQDTDFPARSISVTKNESIIAVAEGNTIYIEENPLKSMRMKVNGKKYGSIHKFLHYVKELQNNDYRMKHLEIYNHWLITPYRIGIAHILASINKHEQLTSTLLESDNKASFCSTINDENPLSISVNLDHKSCIETCLKYLKSEYSKNNTRAYLPLSNCLTALTSLDISSIPRLYDILFQQNKSLHLPNFCISEKTALPSLCHSTEFLVSVEGLLPK